MQKDLSDAEPVRYAALLHSRRSHELAPAQFDEAFEGMYRLLLENHVQFDIVNEEGIQRGELALYKVLVVPDAVSLRDNTAEAIRKATKAGLGVVATHMTGLLDPSGNRRSRPALADLFGIELQDLVAQDAVPSPVNDPTLSFAEHDGEMFRYGSVCGEHPLAKGMPAEGLFGFRGGFAMCEAHDGEVLARIHAPDHARLSARPYNRRGITPGPARWPLAVTRKAGKGHVAYFACQADATWRRAHAPELDTLLLRAVQRAGGNQPLQALDCPPTVEVRLFHDGQRRRYHILLTNLTTNAFDRHTSPGVIRYVTPHKGLQLRLRIGAKATEVSGLLSGKLKHEQKNGSVVVDLPVLDLYERICVQC
jgi:hypothetical protein